MSQYDDHGYGDHDYVEHQTLGGTRQTRTKLPEGEGDPYAAGRRRSPSRNLAAVVGVVVLLVAAIAFANRDSDDDTPGSGTEDRPAAGATAATGTKPVEGGAGGIPSGFARDEQGAQSAATNFAVALGSDGMFDKDRRHGLVAAVHAPDAVASSQREYDSAYTAKLNEEIGLTPEGAAKPGTTFVSRTTPIGAKVKQFSADSAMVEVWCSGLFGLTGQSSKNPVTSSWFTISAKLVWVDGDWKIRESDQTKGPSPVPGDSPVSGSKEIEDAVTGFGGFTYAR